MLKRRVPVVLVVGARGIPDVEGGAEKNAEETFPRIAAMGFDITLVGLKSHITAPEFAGVKLVAAPTIWFLKTDKLLCYLVAIGHAFRMRPDIVHLQGLGAALFLWIYKLLRLRVVVRYGSADYTLKKWGVLGRLGFLLGEYQLRFADAVIAVGGALAERLHRRGIRHNVRVVPNGVDGAGEAVGALPFLTDRPFILAVGRVTVQKNIVNLIHGFKVFNRLHPEFELIIAGGVDDVAYYRALKPLLDPNIRLVGNLPRAAIRCLLHKTTLFANLSLHEGNSNATLEAVSCGCPVLLSDIPENRDMGLDDRHFVDHLDPEKIGPAFSAALTRRADLVIDPSIFPNWDQVAKTTANIYETMLSAAGRS
jgi:glycosyltransferase involved in cell wall biosynthesis